MKRNKDDVDELYGKFDDPVKKRVEQTETGVTVTLKSKRGTETNDRDSVKVQAHYDDAEEAREKDVALLNVLIGHMRELRVMDESGYNKHSSDDDDLGDFDE